MTVDPSGEHRHKRLTVSPPAPRRWQHDHRRLRHGPRLEHPREPRGRNPV